MPLDTTSIQLLGVFFGYPNCCIQATLVRYESGDYRISADQEKVHNGHGFVPCPHCTRQILEGKTTLEGLIKNRVSSLPFPYDEQAKTQREVNKFVDRLMKVFSETI